MQWKTKPHPYNPADVAELEAHAVRRGITFKIDAMPYGAPYDRKLWDEFYGKSDSGAEAGVVSTVGTVETSVVDSAALEAQRATQASQEPEKA